MAGITYWHKQHMDSFAGQSCINTLLCSKEGLHFLTRGETVCERSLNPDPHNTVSTSTA